MGRDEQVGEDAGAGGNPTDDGSAGHSLGPSVEAGEADRYLVELGERVRMMRAVRGMSRRVLANQSGVSERYIAQLESGQGNVSIMSVASRSDGGWRSDRRSGCRPRTSSQRLASHSRVDAQGWD
jgi:DNA-binding XRE family transcriptional regulator